MSAPSASKGPSLISPLEAFTADIRSPKLSPLYTVGLAVVAFAMVLLPAIYIALIGLTAWGVLSYLAHPGWIMGGGSGGGLARLLIYLGPPVAGGILVFFMLKPLFARRAKAPDLLTLDPEKEKLLFAFVRRVCQLVRAPMPSRIDVDCQVNASASLRRGLWSRDLVLTIGLPLAAGLNMREFAGVLAHEFGHFAQGAGMRLTYIIRNINFWFARVVYERDKWDVSLEQSAKNSDIRIGIILHGARGCVWLTRRILWALMHAGNAISCFMLRQMEFDADSYEAKVAGSTAFESTATRLRVLNVATQVAIEDVRHSWAAKRLPENLPLLVEHKAQSLSSDVHQKLNDAVAKAKTGWFDTHPCDSDRVKAAQALNEPGVFRVECPATELFADFISTSRAVTRHEYEKKWELTFGEQNLISSEEMLRESKANAEADAVARKFYGEVNVSILPLLTSDALPEVSNREAALAQWHAAREECKRLQPAAAKASAEWVRQQQRLADFTTAYHLTAAGFRIEGKEFGLPEHAASVSEQETAAKHGREEATRLAKEQIEIVSAFIAALRTRLTRALQLRPAVTPATNTDTMELDSLLKTLAAVGASMPSVHQLGLRLRPFVTLAQNRGNHSDPATVEVQMSRLSDELRRCILEVQQPLQQLPYPYPHPRGKLTLVEYASNDQSCDHVWETVFREANAHLDRLFPLHYRLLGRTLVLADSAEGHLAANPPVATEVGN